ncbi:MAG: hypothetical protein KME35_16010 [Aphanocapsa sp. GSE-SYN-MK-11-07L]|jgi:hypothetical protein|nr:hypothetical protein [Aphanocapsa sp. GSE-SYN-MK-11-07L]
MELIVKSIALVNDCALWLLKLQDTQISRLKHREDYKFLTTFLADIENSNKSHPLLIEKGFSALYGLHGLTISGIRYLLAQPNPSTSIQRYLKAQKYVEYLEDLNRFDFRKEYKFKVRNRAKRLNGIGYIVFAALALLMIFISPDSSDIRQYVVIVAIQFMVLLLFGYLAFACLARYGRILRAEELIADQHPITQSAISFTVDNQLLERVNKIAAFQNSTLQELLIKLLNSLDDDNPAINSLAEEPEYDPITPLIGSLHLGTHDLGENHDRYIGQSFYLEIKGDE